MKGMRMLEADSPQVRKTISVVAALLWVPLFVPVMYVVSHSNNVAAQISTLAFSVVVLGSTWVTARLANGDVLMVLCALVGFLSELLVVGEPDSEGTRVSKNLWFLACAAHGLLSGILCKAKDIQDERYYDTYTVTERLYLVVPYTIGIWSAFVWMRGSDGLVEVFKSIFFCLALCGYGVLAHRVLQWSGVYGMDLIALINHLFTTSFGVVFTTLGLAGLAVVYLGAPFVQSLLSLNGVVSALGILVEIVIYDIA